MSVLSPRIDLLLATVALDYFLGDPVYRWHPVRLFGRSIRRLETLLRAARAGGYAGGCVLSLTLVAGWGFVASGAILLLDRASTLLAAGAHLFLLYSLVAYGDLLRHGGAVDSAVGSDDLRAAREAVADLVGRDTAGLDGAACRRAAIESLAENLVDGFISPVFWYLLAGLPGLVAFKVVSTLDSMVGYRTERYLQFGWCGARLDDLLNLVPARLSWLLMAGAAALLRGCSARKAIAVGWKQHSLVPGPNSGWSEASMAGAIQRRLVGPIWENGALVTDLWLGIPGDPEGGTGADYRRAAAVSSVTAAIFVLAALGLLLPR